MKRTTKIKLIAILDVSASIAYYPIYLIGCALFVISKLLIGASYILMLDAHKGIYIITVWRSYYGKKS